MPRPLPNTTRHSWPASGAERVPVPCPYCGRPLPVWAVRAATASGVWVKCKNPSCKREVEIKL